MVPTRAVTLADEILYPSDAQWSGRSDRMTMRRRGLAAFST